MLHNLKGIDHALIGVEDLEEARSQYEKLGFTLTPRGSHIGWGTANYCIMFDEDYIEILGIVDPSLETNGLDTALEERGEGLLGLALASDEPEETQQSLAEAGLEPSDILLLKRKLELPEGDVLPEFKLIRLTSSAGLSAKNLFICHHMTPELVRQEKDWLSHANGAKFINSIVVVVDDPDALAEYYQRLCGSINVTQTDNTLTVRFGRGSIIFVNDRDIDLLFPGLTISDEMPPLPHLIAMTIVVDNLQETENTLTKNGIKSQKIATGTLRVNPPEANGILLEFTDRPAS
ncbi:VOC family protein [uncultured Sneathiella sp.]|jgi:catechol 2,3-dioxygenase-like lactoylglutathione lyase family enzyme|uniref:VOC family protein n=1 Tax=uncultured Sneathiella sp. TaxID=879315 RepID=UPI0030D782F4|tara:strand:+ start:1222 stop:2094 length:873 start_codon:yes stop_codon:yes gene_type:complete